MYERLQKRDHELIFSEAGESLRSAAVLAKVQVEIAELCPLAETKVWLISIRGAKNDLLNKEHRRTLLTDFLEAVQSKYVAG